MKNRLIIIGGIAVFLGAGIGHTFRPVSGVIPVSTGDEDNPNARDELEFLVQRDPVTNAIPDNIQKRERQFAARIPTREQAARARGESTFDLVWTERGPNNVGGRSRVLAADAAHPGTLIAGAVAGGIWKSTDEGASWYLKLAPSQVFTTSCIAQDLRPGRTNVWYVGTGEFRGSTTNDTRWGSFYRGDGIYKSTDNGESWTLLPSTVSGTPQITDTFDYCWNVATNPANLAQDEVYAATWNGIYRSTNGGTSWTTVEISDSGLVNTAGFSTDVAVTSTGVVYASTKLGGVPKIWRSADGTTWTSIEPPAFPTSSGRIVLGLAPSNVNVVYVYVQGPNNTPATAGHQLWKYTYAPGGGTWENRGGNLPSDLTTQTGYDQLVQVKPDDENFVLLSGTNLYRSTDGFATSSNTATIGGYPFWPGQNHHPDVHSGAFKPGNTSVYYSGHDGGLSRAADITLSSMTWTSMNNGYDVTQFYSVSISPDSGDNAIAAGAQDNGSQATNLPGLSAWTMVSSGDGTIVELAPIADDRIYTQSQSGPLYKLNRAGQSLASMQPSGSTNQLFVNPIALDPNDSRILYYAGGKSTSPSMASGLWRNSNAPAGTTTAGWTALTGTNVGTVSGWTRAVSAIGISKSNNANVVYFGTTDGLVKRVDSANAATPAVTDVTPPGLNGGTAQGGFVRCVAVDPANSSRALVAFGNYNFRSLWYTTDAGATWSDVEGNLAGPSGPSVRWATVFYLGSQLNIYLGTSIGLLMTNALNGASTVWAQAAPNDIGNVLIAYLDYRASDRTLAVGTHARGVFTTQFPVPTTGVDASDGVAGRFTLEQNYPNPFNPTTTIAFTLGQSSVVDLRLYDVAGKEVAVLVNQELPSGRHVRTFSGANLASGVYLCRLSTGGYVRTMKMVLLQ